MIQSIRLINHSWYNFLIDFFINILILSEKLFDIRIRVLLDLHYSRSNYKRLQHSNNELVLKLPRKFCSTAIISIRCFTLSITACVWNKFIPTIWFEFSFDIDFFPQSYSDVWRKCTGIVFFKMYDQNFNYDFKNCLFFSLSWTIYSPEQKHQLQKKITYIRQNVANLKNVRHNYLREKVQWRKLKS